MDLGSFVWGFITAAAAPFTGAMLARRDARTKRDEMRRAVERLDDVTKEQRGD